MPAKSPAQRKAAGAELGRRRRGLKKSKGRSFGTASIKELRKFARKFTNMRKKK
tara:strand:- start:2082 stop:2243 length:162 start_codon:yes stop_codon:yes gene_type:complete